jgi:phage protein U
MFALLGEIPFEVLGSPETFESSRHFDYAEHRVIEDRPRLQWLAAELESITLAMLFHTSFTYPAPQLAALLAAANDHQARALVLGNGSFRGFFVVESVATSDIQLGADAAPVAIRVSANFANGRPARSSIRPRHLGRLRCSSGSPVAINYTLPIHCSGPAYPPQTTQHPLSISPASRLW